MKSINLRRSLITYEEHQSEKSLPPHRQILIELTSADFITCLVNFSIKICLCGGNDLGGRADQLLIELTSADFN